MDRRRNVKPELFKLIAKVYFTILALFISMGLKAQSNIDSAAYRAERNKINSMLAVRSQKFGEYDRSVHKHTGIFGLQTKKDIRRSNDILMNIVTTDDNIFRELKVLLDYRAFEQTQVQTQTIQVKESSIGYMTTINKLRSQIAELKNDNLNSERQIASDRKWIIILIVLFCALGLLTFFGKNKRRT